MDLLLLTIITHKPRNFYRYLKKLGSLRLKKE